MKSMSEKDLLERKAFYKMLLTPLPHEDRIDEIAHLPDSDLLVMLAQFEEEEEYEICHAVKAVLSERDLG